jgi:DNA-binding GntR family transcriptional regulator
MGLPDLAGFSRETSPTAVGRYLRALIVNGTLRRGERVPRDEIARALGVSPVPVREAIIGLDREGWLRIEPHRGAFVHGVDEAWVTDHYQLMGAVYGLVATRATERASGHERAELVELGDELQHANGVAAFDAINERITRTLVAMARSPRLDAALRGIPNIVPGSFFSEVAGTIEPQRAAITATVHAVASGDGERAAATMRTLASRQGAAVVALLRARGVIASDTDTT